MRGTGEREEWEGSSQSVGAPHASSMLTLLLETENQTDKSNRARSVRRKKKEKKKNRDGDSADGSKKQITECKKRHRSGDDDDTVSGR